MTSANALRPAASLILFREPAGAQPEILMVQRAAGMAFAGGLWVFPGGRVEPADGLPGTGLEDEDAAARVAAIRETIEEVGVAVGLRPLPDAAALAAIRASLSTGKSLHDVLAEAGFALDLDGLVPFARWVPMHDAPRRFDTRFYLSKVAEDVNVEIDGGESVSARWVTAAAALAHADRKTMPVIFPTRCNLVRLERSPSFAAAAAAAAKTHPIVPIEAFVEERDGEPFICIKEGHGYPAVASPFRVYRAR